MAASKQDSLVSPIKRLNKSSNQGSRCANALKSVTNGDDDVKERSFKKTSKTLNRKEMSSKTEKNEI